MGAGFGGCGYRGFFGLAARSHVSCVPELNRGIGFRGGEEEVLAAGRQPLDRSDGGGRGDALGGALVSVVDGVDRLGKAGSQVRVAADGARNTAGRERVDGDGRAAQIPDLDTSGSV